MSTTRNPTQAIITAPDVVQDSVTAFHLSLAQDNANPNAEVDVAVPSANGDGTYTVSLSTLFALLSSAYFGLEYNLGVQCVNSHGNSLATIDPNKVVYQPVPSAPSSVSAS